MTPAAQARTYCEKFGWHLVPIPAGSKGPTKPRWQSPENTISTGEAAEKYWTAHDTHNMGLLHDASGTCALDIDNVEWTRMIFDALGIDLKDIMSSNVRIIGDPARGKALFRAPPGSDLKTHKVTWPDPDDPRKTHVVFELRAGAVQDVLPPSIHPSGRPYAWSGSPSDGLKAPPEQLMTIWQNWDTFRGQMVDICPWARKRVHNPAKRSRIVNDDTESVIDAYNAAFPVGDLLLQHGYKPTRGGRYLSPNSTSGLAGVVVFEDGRAYSHHASDPFDNAHAFDAFDVFCQYEHLGDMTKAVADAAKILDIKSRPAVDASPERMEAIEHGGMVKRQILPSLRAKIQAPKADALAIVPDHLLTVPGVLGHAVNFYNTTAIKPQPQFAVQSALAYGSVVLGRRYVTDQKNYPSLYFLCIGGTACGKEHIKSTIDTLLDKSGLSKFIGPQGYTSGSGVLSALIRQPNHVSVMDEFGRFMEAVKKGQSSNKLEAITAIMEAFGRTHGVMRPLGYSTMSMSEADAEKMAEKIIKHPALTIVGITTPSTFYESMDSRYVLDGLLNRFIIVESLMPRSIDQVIHDVSPSDRLTEWAIEMANKVSGDGNLTGVDSHDLPPKAHVVPFSAGAMEMLATLGQQINQQMDELEADGLDAMLGRTKEQAQRLSLIVALSKGEAEISEDSLRWAIDYVTFYAGQSIPALKSNMYESELDAVVRKVHDLVSKSGIRGITEAEISRRLSSFRKLSPQFRKQVFEILKVDWDIKLNDIETQGRARQAYTMPGA